MMRRDPRIWQIAFAAAIQAINSSVVKPRSIICATALGALDETAGFLDGVFKDGFGSPRHFIASVHNSMAGRIALELKIDGPNLTICDGQNSFASAIVSAGLIQDADFPALILCVDENTNLLNTVVPHLSSLCREYLSQDCPEASVAFIIDRSGIPDVLPVLFAAGPQPAAGRTPQETLSFIIKENNLENALMAGFPQSSCSFTAPPAAAFGLYDKKQPGTHIVGSFSPSADAAAFAGLKI
jgi:hypothetical protein